MCIAVVRYMHAYNKIITHNNFYIKLLILCTLVTTMSYIHRDTYTHTHIYTHSSLSLLTCTIHHYWGYGLVVHQMLLITDIYRGTTTAL